MADKISEEVCCTTVNSNVESVEVIKSSLTNINKIEEMQCGMEKLNLLSDDKKLNELDNEDQDRLEVSLNKKMDHESDIDNMISTADEQPDVKFIIEAVSNHEKDSIDINSNSLNCIINIEHLGVSATKINNDKSKICIDAVSLSEPCCRVCQCNSEEEVLISPCHCSGSVKWVHETCLVHWMKSSFKDSCELCLRKIEIAKRIKPLSKWTLPSRRPTPVIWVLVFVTAIALNLASIVKDASKLCSTTPCLVFYAVGCMGIILGSLFLIFWTKRARSFFNHWLEQNEEWVIVLENNEESQMEKSMKCMVEVNKNIWNISKDASTNVQS